MVELIELGDRLATGMRLPAAARAMGITNEFRARALAAQARLWSTEELQAALAALVELDAMVKGVPGWAGDQAQRRLAFTMWVRDHAGRNEHTGRDERTPAGRSRNAARSGRSVGPG
jgi:hypothetical protein